MSNKMNTYHFSVELDMEIDSNEEDQERVAQEIADKLALGIKEQFGTTRMRESKLGIGIQPVTIH